MPDCAHKPRTPVHNTLLSGISSGASTTMKKNSKWTYFVDYTPVKKGKGNTKMVPFHCVWREAECNDWQTFNRYGFGIFMFVENGRKTYQCCICQRKWNKGGFAQGLRCASLEEAYADLPSLLTICAKTFGFRFPISDSIYLDRRRDFDSLAEVARRNNM